MSTETVARLRIVLDDVEPHIWRRVDVPVDISLKLLHDIIQAAMGWENCHLWQFETGRVTVGKTTKLAALLDRGVRKLTYTYDMGDDWRHTIKVESTGPGEAGVKYPRYIEGKRRCPPEDAGGLPGYEGFLEAMADPAHEEHQHLLEWYGGPYDPDDMDEMHLKLALGNLAKRRHAGKLSQQKRRAK